MIQNWNKEKHRNAARQNNTRHILTFNLSLSSSSSNWNIVVCSECFSSPICYLISFLFSPFTTSASVHLDALCRTSPTDLLNCYVNCSHRLRHKQADYPRVLWQWEILFLCEVVFFPGFYVTRPTFSSAILCAILHGVVSALVNFCLAFSFAFETWKMLFTITSTLHTSSKTQLLAGNQFCASVCVKIILKIYYQQIAGGLFVIGLIIAPTVDCIPCSIPCLS